MLNNHIHLLIETRETPLSKILQGINQRYTMYFNRKYKALKRKEEFGRGNKKGH